MENTERILHLDICDYKKRKICPLYSGNTDVSGQAVDIFRTTERNGWKELSFTLSSVCMGANGPEDNYRLEHLKADFLIRAIDDAETDWYIISTPKIKHNAFSKTVQVTAGHVSQLLKLKNLGLEFSDSLGNNVGTADELLDTILAGTGWTVGYVYPFAEKDGSPKRRSLKASAKTGAFKLISMMCTLFDAKPVFHGDARTVDIVPINPFSEPAPGKLPDLTLANNVIELHYGKNVSNVERTENTENIVTKLYAYGSYGDKTSGYCGIDECTHVEYEYTLTAPCAANETYHFAFKDTQGVELIYHFTPSVNIPAGGKLIYSLMDPSSMLYIWDDSNQNAYPATKLTNGLQLPATVEVVEAKNWFQFVMNFDYYRTVGLMTDDMIQQLGEYQRNAPKLYQNAADASLAMSDAQTTLSETIGYIDFCKLHVDREEPLLGDGYTTLILDKSVHKDGVIYRSDYDKNADNYFKLRITESLNTDGDPLNAAAGLVYIVHDTVPVSWDKAYLKAIDDEDNPTALTLWSKSGEMNIDAVNDQFFLFSYNGINGRLGTLESNDESAIMSLEEALRVVTVDHPVVFTASEPLMHSVSDINGYGWLWKYSLNGFPSELYFAYVDEGDQSWKRVYFTDADPSSEEGSYWYDWRASVLRRRSNSSWQLLDTSAEKKVAALFATVFMFCKARDRYYQGVSENYTYTVPKDAELSAGNYFFENEYNSYWAFTTTTALHAGDTLTYNYDKAWVTQIHNGVESSIKPRGYRFDNVNYHPANILDGKVLENGVIEQDGSLNDAATGCRSQSCISVVPLTTYYISDTSIGLQIHYYDDKQNWMSCENTFGSFVTPGGCTYIRICASVSFEEFAEYDTLSISAANAERMIVIEDLNYTKLDAQPHGENIGLISCVQKFADYADETYWTCYGELKAAQDAISKLEQDFMLAVGDIYREGWWNDASYVDGDEDKLYEDALDNLNQVAKPEATYNVSYLDLQETNIDNAEYGAADETISAPWPDVSDMDAIHLIDPELSINAWAFVDKIQKCHDKPWQTKLAINTNLSTIAQHSFTDVMTNIATVASEMKGKASYYDKTIGSAASGEDINAISASMSKNEKELLSAVNKVEEINGTVLTYSSQIKQTAMEISAEVKRSTDQDAQMAARIKVEADKITSEVQRATKAEAQLSSTIEQTAQGIAADIKRVEDGAATAIKATADGLSAEVTRATQAEGALSGQISSVQQTAEGLSTRVQNVENSSIIKQTAKEIQAVVSNAEIGNAFKTSSVSISEDGVAISTSGEFSVSAGADEESSAVVINKNGVAIGSSGVLTVQTDNFGITADGKISATDAVINGQISNNGYPVLSKNYDIYIGSEEPAANVRHVGMIWIKPGVPTSGGGSSGGGSSGSEEVVVPTNQTVTFTGLTNSSKRHWFYEEDSAYVVLTANNYSVGSKPSYNYTVTIPVYLARRTDGQKHGAKFKVSLNGSVVLTENKVWTASASSSNMSDTVTLSGTSSVWLGNLNSITAVISISRESTGSYTGNIYLNSAQTVTATCS